MEILDLVGRTPLVKLSRMNPKKSIEIYLKLEYFNPTGSIKDRIAKKIIEEAEKKGILKKGMTILEATSGNTGIAVSWVGAVKGYPVKIILPKDVTEERIKILKALGAEIIFVDTEKDAILLAKKLYKDNPEKYFYVNQFENELNVLAQRETAKEIFEEIGVPDYLIAGIGTAGTVMGLATFFKDLGSKVIGVVPEKDYEIDGLVNPKVYKQPLLKEELLDEIVPVKREDAIRTMKRLVREEGILAGVSTGATTFVALKISEKMERGKVVAIAADSFFRYLSIIE